MRPPAGILDRLNGVRLLGQTPGLSFRQGERRSTAKGAGLEFASHRPYREGDDLRHLDTRLYARLRQPFVREYLADRQLRVAILVDTSASMAFGSPSKLDIARMLAGLLGYAGLSSGDLVEVAQARANRIDWSEAMQGASRSDRLFRWIDADSAPGAMPFPEQLRAALPRLRAANAILVISDWWIEDIESELQGLGDLSGQFCALQVTAPEEEAPALAGGGSLRLADAESDDTLDLVIDQSGMREYAQLLARHRDTLQTQVQRRNGRFLALRSDMPTSEMLMALMRAGFLG